MNFIVPLPNVTIMLLHTSFGQALKIYRELSDKPMEGLLGARDSPSLYRVWGFTG